jgi:outer membrane protein OmpA-like peptidoglycan-associated protein
MRILLGILLVFSLIALPSCNANKATKGAGIGAAAGGVIGAIVGAQSDNTALGAIVGATVGGTAGGLIGRKMDRQAEELEKEIEGAEIARVEEGIKVTFDSGLMFAVNKSELTDATRENLSDLAANLNEHKDTEILIEGHTDASGSEEYNQELSKKRAQSVTDYLVAQGVDGSRLSVIGYGESQPVADNETEEGKQANRRVELAITANEAMIEAAENGTLDVGE